MSVKILHQVQQEGLDVLVEKLGPDDASGSFISMNREAMTGRKTGKNMSRLINSEPIRTRKKNMK